MEGCRQDEKLLNLPEQESLRYSQNNVDFRQGCKPQAKENLAQNFFILLLNLGSRLG